MFFGTLVPAVEPGPPFVDVQKQLAELLLQYPTLQITYRRIPFLESEFDQYVTYELPPMLCFQMFAIKGPEIMIQVLQPQKRLFNMQFASDVRAFHKLVTTTVPPPVQFSYASLAVLAPKTKKYDDDALDDVDSLPAARPDVVGLGTEHVSLFGNEKTLWEDYLWPFFQLQGQHLQSLTRERDHRASQYNWNRCGLTKPETTESRAMVEVFKFYCFPPHYIKVHAKGSNLLFTNSSDCVACLRMIWHKMLPARNFIDDD
jgi:hypothetical protein